MCWSESFILLRVRVLSILYLSLIHILIGWASLANINKVNKSASTHSIVIGDRDYNDGFTWIETVRFMFEYAFETLKLNRLYGVSLVGHPMSNIIGEDVYKRQHREYRNLAIP